MPTLMQKIRLWMRGRERRRDEANREFLARNLPGVAAGEAARRATGEVARHHATEADIDGLTVAYLDTSGRTTYYLDTQTGDVIESNVALDAARYRRVPTASHEHDRAAFAKAHGLTDADDFRENRKLERAWFNFRNDRAIAAIRAWLDQK